MADERYYRVTPRFWTRADQKGWSDDVKLLALYLLTGPHRTTEGLFRLPKKYAQADLEWSPQRFDERLRELVQDEFCLYDEDAHVVLLVGALRYQACSNPNMAKAAVRRLAELPETWLLSHFRWLVERFDEQLAKALPEGFPEPQALPLAQAPSPGESRPDERPPPPEDNSRDEAKARFEEHFWPVYPPTNGVKRDKAKALQQWLRLSIDDQRAAVLGARNKAHHFEQTGEQPPYAFRFLRDRAFEDFVEAPTFDRDGNVRPLRVPTCPDCNQALAEHDDDTCELVKDLA